MEKIDELMSQIRTNCSNEEMDLLAYKIKEEIESNKKMVPNTRFLDEFYEAQADDADRAFDLSQVRDLK